MNIIKTYPIVYKVSCKRGLFWEEKNLELHREFVQYVHTKTNEVRFKVGIDDCILSLKDTKRKFRVRINSKKNNFKTVSLKCSDNEVLKRFKSDFEATVQDKINLFSSKISNIPSSTNIDLSVYETEGTKKKDNENIIDDIFIKRTSCVENILIDKKYVKKILLNINYELIENNHIFSEKFKIFNEKKYKFLMCKGNIMFETDCDDKSFILMLYTKKNDQDNINNDQIQKLFDIHDMLIVEEGDLKKLITLNLLLALVLLYQLSVYFASLIIPLYIVFVLLNKSLKMKMSESLNSLKGNMESMKTLYSKRKCFLKFSASFDQEFNKILYFLSTPSTFKDWNQDLIESGVDKDDNIYYKYVNNQKIYLTENSAREIYEINGIKRKIFIKNEKNFVIFDCKENNELYKVTTLEYSPKLNKTLIQIVVEFKENDPFFYNDSITNSLYSLISYLNELSFNQDFKCEYDLNPIDKREKFIDFDNKSLYSIKTENKNKGQICDENENESRKKSENINETRKKSESNLAKTLPYIVTEDPEINKENEECYNLILKTLDEYKIFINRDWKLWEQKKDKEYKLYYIDEKSGLKAIKAETIVNKPIKTVFEYIDNMDNKLVYDINFESGKEIRKINDNIFLTYQKYKGKMGFEPRDYYVLLYKKCDGDDSLLLGTSYMSDKYKEVNKIVRANLYFGGFNFKKINDEKTMINFFYLSDLKISNFFFKMAVPDIAIAVINIRENLSK